GSQRHELLMPLVARAVDAGRDEREQRRRQSVEAFSGERAIEEDRQDSVLDEMEQLITYKCRDVRERCRLRRHVKDQGHVDNRWAPQEQTAHLRLTKSS